MRLTEELKEKIDRMSYKEMLTLYRFTPSGDPLFEGASGDYFLIRKKEKAEKVDVVAISKEVGWIK